MAQQPNVLEAAKQGKPQAITALLNRNLQPKGITVKVASKPGGVLQILLEAAQAPDAQDMATFIQQGMMKLQPDGVRSLRIFGRTAGEKIPDWSRDVDLTVADISPSPVPEPEPPAESAQAPAPVKPEAQKPMPLVTKLLVAGAIAFWPAMILLGSLPDGKRAATTTQITTNQSTAPAPAKPKKTLTPGKYITKDGYIGALTKDDFDEAIGYLVKEDRAALQSMFDQSRAFPLKPGITVYLEKCDGFLCSTVKVRPEGETFTFYTNREALGDL